MTTVCFRDACKISASSIDVFFQSEKPFMKLLSKGLLLVAIPGLCELVLLAIVYQSQRHAAMAEAHLLHTKDVIIEVARVREPVLLQAEKFNTDIIFGHSSDLSQNDFWKRIDSELDKLAILVQDDPDQIARVDSIRSAVHEFREFSHHQIALLNNQQRAQLMTILRDPAMNRHRELIRAMLADFIAIEQGLDDQRFRYAEQARQRRDLALLIAFLGSVLTSGVVAYLLSRDLIGRLAVVTTNALRLSRQEPLVNQVGGRDEVSELDQVLHQASARLCQAEQAERAYREELEWRARQLDTLNTELQRQTQENAMFIYGVSHDLRSPLLNLQGFGSELQRGIATLQETLAASALHQEQKRHIASLIKDDIEVSLNYIRSAVTRSTMIIDALLRLSRTGRVEYQVAEVDVDALVRRIIDAMSATIRQSQASVMIEAPPLPACYGDATAIEQVFGNLIGNAVNYLDPARAGRVSIGALANDSDGADFRTYYVRDNGRGIAAAALHKMFSLFQRLHADSVQGEGIGLALVKCIVMRHGGKIWVESLEGSGSTFYVSLPLSQSGCLNAVDNQSEGSYV